MTAYYPGYEQSYLPPSAIDFTVISHVIHFSIVPNADGSLNTSANNLTPAYSATLISQAHSAGAKVLVCVGGANSETGFLGATTSARRSTFISNLKSFVVSNGYDGLDIDWEPLPAADFNQYTNFVLSLRSALNTLSPRKLLTVAAGAYPSYGDPPQSSYAMFAALQDQFDQINVMTYDLSGPYPGWVTWFNSPIYDGGYRFPSTGGFVPSMDGAIKNFQANGVASAKLGIGIPFYGDVWTGGAGTPTGGVLLPRQGWSIAPSMSQAKFSQIMSSYFNSNYYHWDASAQAAYLSITNAVAASDQFISYDDEHTCQAKVSYARNRFLGGVMIWELAQDYFPQRPVSQRTPLLSAIQQTLATPQLTAIQLTNQEVRLSFTTAPLAAYRVLWNSNLIATDNNWRTLTSNVTGPSNSLGLVEITTPKTVQHQNFFRVQTPP